jgi:hypothetical protein
VSALEEGIEWGLFLASYDKVDDEYDRGHDDEDRRAALIEVVDLLESARAVNKTTVPVKSIRAALLRGWYQRTNAEHPPSEIETKQAQLAAETGQDINDVVLPNGR